MASPTSRLRGYKAQTLFNITLLLASTFLLSYLLLTGAAAAAVVLAILVTLAIVLRMIQSTDKELERFTQFIRNIAHNDFSTTTMLHGADNSTNELVSAQKTLIGKYRQLKAEKSAQHEYLDRVIEHVDIALLCFDDAGKVVIVNRAAKDLLQTSSIINMRQVDMICQTLGQTLRSLSTGKSQLLKTAIGGESMQLLLSSREFRLLDKGHTLVSIQNIQSAIDETEIASWQKLIKVLTHEIMNSMTPIVSLSSHLEKSLDDDNNNDLARGIRSIASRSQGLLRFVESYRSLSNLPAPVASGFSVAELFSRIALLTADRLSEAGCTLETDINPPDMNLVADRHQIEQILLNLLVNAADAVAGQTVRRIVLKGYVDNRHRPVILVIDTGAGIPAEQLDHIFTPFFTTKESGTGVGLSLSRQLAHLNHATLDVHSVKGSGSTFSLIFARDKRFLAGKMT